MSVDPARDRLQHLLADQPAATWNGIDYVEIASIDQTQLRVHFLNASPVQGTLSATPAVTICGGETIASVTVLPIDEATAWSADEDGRPILSLSVQAPGDFSTYTLTVHSTALDPFFDAVGFMDQTVKVVSGRAAASVMLRPFGTGSACVSCARQYCA